MFYFLSKKRRYSTRFDVKKMCEVLGVKRGSYYRWLKSRINQEKKEQDEKKEIEMIEEVFESSDRIWGYRNITKALKSKGFQISEYRVRRLMRENGFYPELAVKFKPQRNGKSDGRYCENRVKQEFSVKEQSLGGGYYIYKNQCRMGISCSGNGSV